MTLAVPLRRRFVRYALLGIFVLAIGVLAALAFEVRTEMRSFREDPVDNIHWNLTQLELDLVRLLSSAELVLNQPDAPLDDLRRRFDLFYSRTDVVRSGAMFGKPGMDGTVGPMVVRLDDFLERTTPLIDGTDAQLRDAVPDLIVLLQDLGVDLRSMSIRTVDQYAALADERRADLAMLLRQIAWTAAALLALLIVLLASVLFLNRQAERKTSEVMRVSSRLQATVATALDGVVVAGMDGRVLDFNRAAERIFGYSRDEAIGESLDRLIVPPRHVAGHIAGMARLRDTGQMKVVDAGRMQITAKRKSGEEFPVEMSISSNAGPDGLIFISFLRDISEPLANERALLAARDKALAAEQAKTNFMAVMSHEMRTPLNGVMAALEIVSRKASDPAQAKFVRLAQTSARQLLRHVNDVLDISKVEAGHLALSDAPFELLPLVTSLVDVLRPVASERGTVIELHALSDLPPVRGDSFRLGQIVQNLLSNAVKFTERGKIVVEIEAQKDGTQGVLVDLRVADNGIGIAPDDLERIFEDFVMLDPSYGREGAGTGLGLAISRRLADAMGGTVGADSELGQGSCFWLRLPLRLDERADTSAARPRSLPIDAPAGLRELDLLVVEDNATNRVVMEEMLRHLGHRITLAIDGAEGVAKARAHRYDAILMDISMPVMDGMEATALIRAGGESRDSRIVAVTAHTMPEELARFREAGMDDCLTKPMSTAQLSRVLAARPDVVPTAGSLPEASLLDAARLDELRQALGADGMVRTLARFQRDTASTLDRIGRSDAAEELLALCHEIAGAAAMVGATQLQAHFVRLEAQLRSGDAAAPARARALSARIWAATEAALTEVAAA